MEQFGKYQLIRRIGSGGMAEVFLARTTVAQGLAKQMVIKKIHPAFARSRQFVSMFVDEAKIALGLNHPNIVQVFDFGQVGDTFFLAMEYVEGFDLLRLMHEVKKNKEPIPLGLCAYVVQQAAKGLDYAHRKTDEFGEPLGIVHRDISPQNVLVSHDGAVKIVDFGIARARDVHEEEGVVKGKFAYMAPEQARGEPVDRRADVFSAGVVLFELCTGRPLFPGKGRQVLEKVKEGAIPSPRSINPKIPPELEETILRALTFHRDDRFQTGRDLQNALGRFLFQHAAQEEEGAIPDSGTLARFLANKVARENRRPRRPPTAPTTPPPEEEPAAEGAPDLDSSQGLQLPDRAGGEVRQRKHVFVLEGQVCGLPQLEQRVGSERAKRVVQDFFDIAQDIAYKHEAVVHRVGDLDFTLVAGLPVAREDDASRIIRLALALVEALDGIGHDVEPELRLAVGIQRGVALLKSRRGARFDYELGAATTAIARRLAAEAHAADILCGGAVYRVGRADWNFEELATIDIPVEPDTSPGEPADADSVTGTKQARVYRLRAPKERQQRLRERSAIAVELIGRDLELKALRDAYRDVLVSGQKRHLLVIGEAGVGKRALVSALLEGIPRGEAVILRAAARAASSYTPFGMVADLGRDLLGLAEGADPREIQRRLEMIARQIYPAEVQSDEVRGLMEAAGLLLGVRGDESRFDAAQLRQRLLQAMMRVKDRFLGDKPLVVIAEDVQWADQESMELFTELLAAPSHRGILDVFTARPDDKVIETAENIGADVLHLEELDQEDRLELVTRRFVPGEDARELARQVVARAGGNPFFINEMVDALVDRGILVPEPEESQHAGLLRWVKREAPIQVPTSVEALLNTRIDRLPEEEKTALIHAAVLGRRFGARSAEELLGKGAEDKLSRLVERGLIRKDGGNYAFANEMTMTVAYQLLPDEERSALHRMVADRLIQSPSFRAGRDEGALARHLELAGADGEAADRYLSAAAHAVNVGGNSDAFRQLTRALRLLRPDDHERRFSARRQREDILRRLARRPAQLREVNSMLREAEAIGDDAKLAIAHSRLAQFYIDVGKADSAEKAVKPALEHARRSGDKLAEAEAIRLRAAVARLHGQNERALELTEEALSLCGEDRDGLFQRATTLNNRGTTLWNMSRLREAIESYAEALVIYRMLKLPRLEARSLNNMGVVFTALGEIEDALAHYKSSLKLDQQLGDRASIALKLGNIGQVYADIGDLDRGERYLSKALALTEQMGDKRSMTDITVSLGQAYFSQGETERATEYFERGLALATENQDRYQEIRALIYLSMAQTRAGGSAEEALALAERASEQAHRMPMPVGEIFGLTAQALALEAQDRAAAGAELTARAVELQRSTEQPEGSEEILHIHSRLCERAGRKDDALRALEAAWSEVRRKAKNLTDRKLRETYLSARVPSAIKRDYERLTRQHTE